MHVCVCVSMQVHTYYLLLYHIHNFRVTNITINEVDQPLISNVIEVCIIIMYICVQIYIA